MTAEQIVPFILIPGFTIILILISIIWYQVKDNAKDDDKKIKDLEDKFNESIANINTKVSKIESNSIPNIEKTIIRLEAKVETLLDNVAEVNLNLKSTVSALTELRETIIGMKYQVRGKKIDE